MNKSFFTGRVTRDWELRKTQNNKTVASSGIAVNTGYGEYERTDFFNMNAWGKTAEALNLYAPKGTKIIVECEAHQNKYTDRSGHEVNTVNFTVLGWEFAERKKQNNTTEEQNNQFRYDEFDITDDKVQF